MFFRVEPTQVRGCPAAATPKKLKSVLNQPKTMAEKVKPAADLGSSNERLGSALVILGLFGLGQSGQARKKAPKENPQAGQQNAQADRRTPARKCDVHGMILSVCGYMMATEVSAACPSPARLREQGGWRASILTKLQSEANHHPGLAVLTSPPGEVSYDARVELWATVTCSADNKPRYSLSSFAGSQFPSRKVWFNGIRERTVGQRTFADLWTPYGDAKPGFVK